jgi:small-conductance mechanosensitive channel
MSQPFGGSELPPAPRPPEGWALPQAGPAPSTVVNAVRLMLLRSAFGVISVIVLFATKDDLKQRILKDSPDATNSTVNAELGVAVGIGIVILVFYVFLAFQVRKGANWARVVTFVIAGLGILGALISFGQPDPPLSRALGVVVALLDVAVVVLLASGRSNRFFKRR